LRLAGLALVVLGDERRAEARGTDVAPQQNQRLSPALRALPGFADGAGFFERVADGEIHQTIRLTRFHPTKIIDAAASQILRRMYQGLGESLSRRPPRGRARRSGVALV